MKNKKNLIFVIVLILLTLGLTVNFIGTSKASHIQQVYTFCANEGITQAQCDAVISLLDNIKPSDWQECLLNNIVELTECDTNGTCKIVYTWLDYIKVYSINSNEHPEVNITLIPIDGGGGTGQGYTQFTIIAPDGGGGGGPGIESTSTYYIYLTKYKSNGETETSSFNAIDMLYETHSIRQITLE